MNFELTDEQRMLVDSASRYVMDCCNLEDRRKANASDDGFSREHWAKFAEMGWLLLTIPEEADGLGGDMIDVALLMEELGRGLVNEPVIDSSILGVSILTDAINNSVAKDLLGSAGFGETILTLAHIENDGRSEFETEVTTQASKTDNGWALSGTKQRVFFGHNADCYLTTAKTPEGELAIFAVPSNADGIRSNSYEMLNGNRAADLYLDQVNVSADALLLQGDNAQAALDLALDKCIIAGCGAALGSMEVVMHMTAEYLKTRVQYGKPLAQFQSLQHRIAEMLVETEQARSILIHALSLFDNAEKRRSAVSAAKVLVSKAARWVSAEGIQLHGGIGVTEEFAVGHHYKAMLTFEQRFGDSDWHLDQYANNLSAS